MSDDLAYNLDAIRNKMRKKKGGSRDPNEWRCDKAEDGKKVQYKFFILPPTDTMDLWYYEHGNHFIDNKVIQCPRIHDGDECPLCQYGFDLMKDTNDKDERRSIARNYLASSRFAVNIYFPKISSTPVELRDKVMWYSMPQSVFAICEEVIMRDPPEDDAIEPEPYGIFFDPNKALPFLLEAKKKGDFNSYESSHFINKPMPISKGDIDEILSRRHDITSVFDDRSVDVLQTIVDNLTGNSARSTKSSTSKAPEKAPEKSKEKPEEDMDDLDDLDDLDELSEAKEKPSKPKSEPKSEHKSKDKSEDDVEIEEEDEDLTALLEELNS